MGRYTTEQLESYEQGLDSRSPGWRDTDREEEATERERQRGRQAVESPDLSDIIRTEIISQLGEVTKPFEEMTAEERRVVSGTTYDPEFVGDDEPDIPRAAEIRREIQPETAIDEERFIRGTGSRDLEIRQTAPEEYRPHTWTRDRTQLSEERQEALLRTATEETIARHGKPIQSAVEARYARLIDDFSQDEAVRLGVASGRLVTDRFQVAPARGYVWEEPPTSDGPLPGVRLAEDAGVMETVAEERREAGELPTSFFGDPEERRGTGEARPGTFAVAPGADDVSNTFFRLIEQGTSARDAANFMMRNENSDQHVLRALQEAREAHDEGSGVIPDDFMFVFEAGTSAWELYPKTAGAREFLEDPVVGQYRSGSVAFPRRWYRYWSDTNREADRLRELGYTEAAKRHWKERYWPGTKEFGHDIMDVVYGAAEMVAISPGMAISPTGQGERERQRWRSFRQSTWANMSGEEKNRAATDSQFFFQKIYENREIFVQTKIQQAEKVEELEERFADTFQARVIREYRIPFRADVGVDLDRYRRERRMIHMTDAMEDMIEYGEDSERPHFELNGELFAVNDTTFWTQYNSLPVAEQERVWDEADAKVGREIEQILVAGSGLTFFDPDHMQTTEDIAEGTWLQNIPVVGPHMDAAFRIPRAGVSRRPSSSVTMMEDGQWLPGEPTPAEFEHRRGVDWLMSWTPTTWMAGTVAPAQAMIMEGDESTGDILYRYGRAIADSPYEYLDEEGNTVAVLPMANRYPGDRFFPDLRYREVVEETGEERLVGPGAIGGDLLTMLAETYEAYIGPHMTKAERMRQVHSIRQGKFLAHEYMTMFGRLADSLELEGSVKNALMISGGLIGFAPEFISPDPIVTGMWMLGKSMRGASSMRAWRETTLPTNYEKFADEIDEIIDAAVAEDRAIPVTINEEMHHRGAQLHPPGQVLAEARAAQESGVRNAVTHHLDELAQNAQATRKAANEALDQAGWTEPLHRLPGERYATQSELDLQVMDLLQGPEGLLRTLPPAKAREQAQGVVGDAWEALVRQIDEATEAGDVYQVWRSESYVQEHFPHLYDELLELAVITERNEEKLIPIWFGRVEGTTDGVWAAQLGVPSRTGSIQWVPVRPAYDDAGKLTDFSMMQTARRATAADRGNLIAYDTSHVFGGQYRGNRGRALEGRVGDRVGEFVTPETKVNELPHWRNNKTGEWESPTYQSLDEAGQLDDYLYWLRSAANAEARSAESLEAIYQMRKLQADEFWAEQGPIIHHYDSAKDAVTEATNKVRKLERELAQNSAPINQGIAHLEQLRAEISAISAQVDKQKKLVANIERSRPAKGKEASKGLLLDLETEKLKSLLLKGQERARQRKQILADKVFKKRYNRVLELLSELERASLERDWAFFTLNQSEASKMSLIQSLGKSAALTVEDMRKARRSAKLKQAEGTKIGDVANLLDLPRMKEIGKRLRAAQYRAERAASAQRGRASRFAKQAKQADPAEKIRKATEKYITSLTQEIKARTLAKVYRDLAHELRTGAKALKNIPEESKKFVGYLQESGAFSHGKKMAKEPTGATTFRGRLLALVQGHMDDGSRVIAPEKLIEYMEEMWSSKILEHVAETVSEQVVHRTKGGRLLDAEQSRSVRDTLRELRKKRIEAKKAGDVQLEEQYKKALKALKLKEEKIYGARGGRAGDVLRRALDAVEEGTPTIRMSLEEVEDFQHINNALRHAWRQTHEASAAMTTVEMLRIAEQDVFGSLTYRWPKITDSKMYPAAITRWLKSASVKFMKMFDPVSLEIGEVSRDVQNVFRAVRNMSDQAGAEVYELARMVDKEFRSMSPAFRAEKQIEYLYRYLMSTDSIEMKHRGTFFNTGGRVWSQMRQQIISDVKALRESETVGWAYKTAKDINSIAKDITAGRIKLADALKKVDTGNARADEFVRTQMSIWGKGVGSRGKSNLVVFGRDIHVPREMAKGKTVDDIDASDLGRVTPNSLLNAHFGLKENEFWYASHSTQSNPIHALSRVFIPQGYTPSHSQAANYYRKTMQLMRQSEADDPRWFFDQVAKLHNKDFPPDPQMARSLAMGTMAAVHGSIMYRANRLMERAVGGIISPQAAADATKFFSKEENTIRGIEAASDVFVRMGRPFTQDIVKIGKGESEKKLFTNFIVSGMDEAGRSYFMDEAILGGMTKRLDKVTKELSHQHAQARTPSEVFRAGAQFDVFRLWRASIVTGLAIPQPRYFYNNFWGDFSQMWLTEGVATATKVNFQLIKGIPFWSDKFNKMNQRMVESLGTENVLGSTYNALMNPTANRIWRGEKGYIRLPDGRLKSYDNIRQEMIELGILDSRAEEELLNAFTKLTPSAFQKLAIHGVGDWMRNISWWATYVQQRQRGNFYMEMLRRGYTEKEAGQRTFNALYDWKMGISEWEVRHLAKWASFYRFWRLAITQQLRSAMQPLIRPSEELINLHTLGIKRGIPSELLGQSGLARVRQQAIVREELPYWTDPALMYDSDEDGIRWDEAAHLLRPEWLTGRPTWGTKLLPDEQQEHYLNLRNQLMPYSINALGPFTALDSSEMVLSWVKAMLGGMTSVGMLGDEAKAHLAPDWEENFWRPTLDMMFPHQKEAIQQFLMTMGWDAGGHHKGNAVRLRPGEVALGNTMFGVDMWGDKETGIPMGSSMDVFMYRMLPIFGTELPGFMGAAWGENYPMQKWVQNPDKFGEMGDLMRGLNYFFGRWGGYRQGYVFNPDQTVEHRIKDVQKAAATAQGYRRVGPIGHYPSGNTYPTPEDISRIRSEEGE